MNDAYEIGRPTPRIDAVAKSTGQEKFAADWAEPGCLWAVVRWAGVPSAKIKSINAEAARRADGVVAVLTAEDIPGLRFHGVVDKHEPVLAQDRIRHAGDPLAIVLAETKAAGRSAVGLIEVDLEELPALTDLDQALAEGAPLIHDDFPGNLLKKVSVRKGDGAAGLDRVEVTVRATFTTPWQDHACLETEAGWGRLTDQGRLEIGASTQAPHRDRMELAPIVNKAPQDVRVISPYPGGAFGRKDGLTIQAFLAVAALHSGGRPVKLWLDREESTIACCKRHPARMSFTLGADRSGRLVALTADLILDTGPYGRLGGEVLELAVEQAGGPYRIPHTAVDGRAVLTNNPIGGPFRGFGAPQAAYGLEQMIDLLAAELKMDPLELRRKNIIRRGEINSIGAAMISTTGLDQCLDATADHPLRTGAEEWKKAAPKFKRRGVGLAAICQSCSYGPLVPDYANAKLELTEAGRIKVYSGVVDMGQGNAATVLQIAGHVLNQTDDNLELVIPDTDLTLPSCGASASRSTYTYGPALIQAAEELKRRLLDRAAMLVFGSEKDQFSLAPGRVRNNVDGQELPLAMLAGYMDPAERAATAYYRAPWARDKVDSAGTEVTGLPHLIFTHGVHLARVEVDELTGQTRLCDYAMATDCGTIVNPLTFHGQMHGGAGQGIGFALTEDFRAPGGTVATDDLATYTIPTSLDLPDFQSKATGVYEPTGPFGLKGAGELALSGSGPAIANAIADAVGVRVDGLPLTAEKILLALNRAAGEEK